MRAVVVAKKTWPRDAGWRHNHSGEPLGLFAKVPSKRVIIPTLGTPEGDAHKGMTRRRCASAMGVENTDLGPHPWRSAGIQRVHSSAIRARHTASQVSGLRHQRPCSRPLVHEFLVTIALSRETHNNHDPFPPVRVYDPFAVTGTAVVADGYLREQRCADYTAVV